MFVHWFSYTLSTVDETRPWIVTSTEQKTVELDEDADFFVWAQENWPAAHFRVDLDPGQFPPVFDRSH